MKDDTHIPLEPVNEAELEARIVAWVLGEASSFEAAELERRCAASPELRLFERRMRLLHELIGENHKAPLDAAWRLSESKRSKITDLLGAGAAAEEMRRQRTVRYFTRRTLFAAAACLALSLIAWPVLVQHEAAARRAPLEKIDYLPGGGGPDNPLESLWPEQQARKDADDSPRGGRSMEREAMKSGNGGAGGRVQEEQTELAAAGKKLAQTDRFRAGLENSPAGGGMGSGGGVGPPPASMPAPARPSKPMPESAGKNHLFLSRDEATKRASADERSLSDFQQPPADLGDTASRKPAAAAPLPETPAAPIVPLTAAPAPVMPAEPASEPADPALRVRSRSGDRATRYREAGDVAQTKSKEADAKMAKASQWNLPLDMDVPADGSGGTDGWSGKAPAGPQNGQKTEGFDAGGFKADEAKSLDDSAVGFGMIEDPTSGGQPGGPPVTGSPFGAARATPRGTATDTTPGVAADALAGSDSDGLSSNKPRGARSGHGDFSADQLTAPEELTKESKPADQPMGETRQKQPQQAAGETPALQFQKDQKADVRRELYTAEGAYNLGKFDDAKRQYEDVIRQDPDNAAARRGLEKVGQASSAYYRAAYDHTRAELLADVDAAWEDKDGKDRETEMPVEIEREMKESMEYRVPEVPTDLDEAIRKQEDAVADRRKTLSTIIQKGMVKLGENSVLGDGAAVDGGAQSPLTKESAVAAGIADQEFTDARTDVEQAQAQLERLKQARLAFQAAQSEVTPLVIIPDQQETAAATEPFSTFSLHVSDASFKLAKAALERGERPAPDSVRPEEFYNAFDYGDPAPAHGEPVACVLGQAAHPVIPQRNLLRIGVRTGAEGRGASTPLNLVLLLDSSGSMEREDRSSGLHQAVRQLAGLLKDGDTVTVAGFARQPRLLADRLPGSQAAKLNDIVARTPSEGGTNLEEGLKLAGELAARQFNPLAQNRVVLFTDGAANLGDAQPEALQKKVETLRQQGIAFDAAGFGADGLNDKLLERLTRNGNGRYYVVDRPEDADANFARQLAGAFRPAAENVKVQVRFNPARVAHYKLLGFEEHRLQKEDFHNDAVDAAEMAAEEAGNALYQIETLPGGEGEVGEVSVRFRDAASGQMVERTWTIPYEAQAPAFDQAEPSLQLAGMAGLVAEKLRGGPLAEAIDLGSFATPMARVKGHYANSPAVADLAAMIEKLR